jgi:hypothetical protein
VLKYDIFGIRSQYLPFTRHLLVPSCVYFRRGPKGQLLTSNSGYFNPQTVGGAALAGSYGSKSLPGTELADRIVGVVGRLATLSRGHCLLVWNKHGTVCLEFVEWTKENCVRL